MSGPQLQTVGDAGEPGVQSALSSQRLRTPGPEEPPGTGAEAAADRARLLRVATREGARVLTEANRPRRVARLVVPVTSSVNVLTTQTETPPDENGRGAPWAT